MNKDYTNLEVWQQCRKLAKEIYNLTRSFPKDEMLRLANQLRRAVVSVPSNIADRGECQTSKDTIKFLPISPGSSYKVEIHFIALINQNDITKEEFETIFISIQSCKRLLNGFINYYRKLL